ncbi:MAG TPA: GNAT family N-acetyltransferase [Stellaceae bacterium]|nr:GNAT family N-acetyltransferase [Stellaceae bacterium]
MYWRAARGGATWRAAEGEPNRNALARLVESGGCHAVLAFVDGAPAGWCDLAPCDAYPRLASKPSLALERPRGSWAVTCFYVPAKLRGRGIARALLEAAIHQATVRGAATLEAYPAEPHGKRLPGAFAYTGVPAMFERAGFSRLDRPDFRRPIYRRALASQAGTP